MRIFHASLCIDCIELYREHFDVIFPDSGMVKGKCNHCGKKRLLAACDIAYKRRSTCAVGFRR